MAVDLLLLRHGQSEGNLAQAAAESGDRAFFTSEFASTPGPQWRLTGTGIAQAQMIGAWLSKEFALDRLYTSPYARAIETAAHLNLDSSFASRPGWRIDRRLAERSWGDIQNIFDADYGRQEFMKLNAWWRDRDPLYWTPPGGESIAEVATGRFYSFLNTVTDRLPSGTALAVTHGDVMWAAQVAVEKFTDQRFYAEYATDSFALRNCEVLHYTSSDPTTGRVAAEFGWVRRAWPNIDTGKVEVSAFRSLDHQLYSSSELLELAAIQPRLFSDDIYHF